MWRKRNGRRAGKYEREKRKEEVAVRRQQAR